MTANALDGDRSSTGMPGLPPSRSGATAEGSPSTISPSTGAADGESFELRDLVLLDSAGNHPVRVHALNFGDLGIGLVGREGSPPRVLPWTSVATHAVEPWSGGTIPRWWMDPGGHRPWGRAASDRPPAAGGDAPHSAVEPHRETATRHLRKPDRPLPQLEAGALIDIQTPSGTFRFLLPRADPTTVADQIAAIAVRHRGVAGASSVTTAVGAGWRGRGTTGWVRVQPILVVALVVVIATAVTLILLQSAGAIHLPFLGGSGGASGMGPRPTAP